MASNKENETPPTPQTDNQTMHSKLDSLEGKVEQLSEKFSQILKDLGKHSKQKQSPFTTTVK